jgi:tRNA-dihydrouridine synthase A
MITDPHPLSVAPMIRCTDRHFRYLCRLISPKVKLYTEMITAAALCYGESSRLLAHDVSEYPLVVQLADHDPRRLAKAAVLCEQAGASEINLNVGCPSDRVQSGRFGVCLMKSPAVVAACFKAMAEAVAIPVTIKTRIGVDDYDSEAFFFEFIATQYEAGCRQFIVHARKAWLKGLSPKQNRDVPPLNYQRVYRLKQLYPDCHVVINGGIDSYDAIKAHLSHVDGVMLGRAIHQNPYLLCELDQHMGQADSGLSREQVIAQYMPYVETQLAKGVRLCQITPHLMGMYHAQPRGRLWRKYLTEQGRHQHAGVDVIAQALHQLGMVSTC